MSLTLNDCMQIGIVSLFCVPYQNRSMGTKRAHSAMEGVHPSRQGQVYGDAKPLKKRRGMELPAHKKQAHSSSVNAIKKRIRDIKRRLERSRNLPATIRVEDERALAVYEQELATAAEEKARQRIIKKYHMVRFFGMLYIASLQCRAAELTHHRAPESYKTSQEITKTTPRKRIYRRGCCN